jgi:hypothetical protein
MFGKFSSGKRLVTFFTSDSMTSDTLSKRPSKGISNKHLKGRIDSGDAFSNLARTSSGHSSDMTGDYVCCCTSCQPYSEPPMCAPKAKRCKSRHPGKFGVAGVSIS